MCSYQIYDILIKTVFLFNIISAWLREYKWSLVWTGAMYIFIKFIWFLKEKMKGPAFPESNFVAGLKIAKEKSDWKSELL